jgi:muramoyltetrapeptide carboxypeptidase
LKVIGLWNAGSPAPKEDLKKGLEHLDKMNVAAVFPAESRRWASRPESAARKFLAGPDEAKVRSLEELAGSREIRDVLALRGGYGGIRLLPLLDKRGFAKRFDKRIWGFSDLTIAQHYFFQKSGCPWVHSPMLSSRTLHSPTPEEARWWNNAAKQLPSVASIAVKSLSPELALRRSQVSGVMLGGNLACLVALMGTPWEPRFPDATVLFLEDINEPGYKIDRLLWQLAGHRDIKHVRAVVLGHFTDSPGAWALLKLWAETLGIPAYKGVKAGHQTPNLPLHMGARVSLERTNEKTAMLETPHPHLG